LGLTTLASMDPLSLVYIVIQLPPSGGTDRVLLVIFNYSRKLSNSTDARPVNIYSGFQVELSS
jgi:hypothetical protein